MESIVTSSIENSMTYQAYRELVKQLTEQKTTTGNEKTEDLVNYTKLNDQRMKRWDKTLKITKASQKKILAFSQNVTWLAITESWCGDAAHVLPVLNKIAELNNHINLRIVLRDENTELMTQFLTFGSRSIPKLIMIDEETKTVINTFGPRPSEATHFVNRYKTLYGTLTPGFKEDLQHWYNNDKGQNIIENLTEMLCEHEANVCQ